MLVPRKPERFEEVARLMPGVARRSGRPDGFPCEPGSGGDLFLLDTMGELTKAYALADVAIVGRSFVPLGGSDPIEPVALGKPTLIGPRHENFRDVVSGLVEAGGIRVTDRPMEVVTELLEEKGKSREMSEAGREVIRRRQGATERHARLLLGLLDRDPGPWTGEGKDHGPEVGMSGGAGPRRRRRWYVLAALGLYMAAGYLTTAFRRIEVEGPADPVVSLPAAERAMLSGVFSVHTERSHDARGTREQAAAAASSARLDFVVIGDHPPDDRRPDWELWEPEVIDGVYIEGGVELRAPEAGKILAIGVDSTYRRWEGDLGSFIWFLQDEDATSMVAHGRGPRESERWVHRGVAGLQGWEVLDLSESLRSRFRGPWGLYHLLTLVGGYPLGLADEALIHSMREGFDSPTVAAYDSLRQQGPLTATAGLNVHPKLSLGPVLVPGYGPFFRTLVSHLALESPLPSDPASAQSVFSEGLRKGELFISLGEQDAARSFRLWVVLREGYGAPMGADAPARSGMVLRGGFEEDPGLKVLYRILRNGREVAWIEGPQLEWAPPRAGLYRVEVYRYGGRVGNVFFRLRPWIFANPIGLMGDGYSPG